MTAKFILATTAVLATLGQGPYVPARLDSGAPPPPRVHVITWGHDYLRLSVDASGRVQQVASLTPSRRCWLGAARRGSRIVVQPGARGG